MQNWLHSLLRPIHAVWGNKVASRKTMIARRNWRPSLECLEDRTVPSTFSSIASNFNGNAIPAGDSIWFNAGFKATGLGAGPVSVHVTNQVISFSAGGTAYNVNVPDSIVNFSAANTTATTTFDAAHDEWITNLPMNWSGNGFLGGATFVAAGGLPGGINPVTWSGNFATDTAGVQLNWQWGAAVYTNFSSAYSSLDIKPFDSTNGSAYLNSDHAGTPEAYKSFVIGGARGGGGSNWTGSYSATASVTPAAQSFTEPASISGQVTSPNGPLAGVLITLTGKDVNGNAVTLTTTTDANGNYQFTNVTPGNYMLTDAAVDGYSPTTATAGTDNGVADGTNGVDQITNITLGSGDVGVNYNFFETASFNPF
jgi:hypothetical protein